MSNNTHIQKLIELYGSTYDYSLSQYKGKQGSIIIIHKATKIQFKQPYSNHLAGMPSSDLNFKFIQYIEKCNEKFKSRFIYSDYKGYNKLVTIFDTHRNITYEMNAQQHYDSDLGFTQDRLNSFEEFKKRAKLVRSEKYKYLEYDWENRKVKYFSPVVSKTYVQNLYDHLSGYVCEEEKSDIYFQEFKKKAQKIHNFEYDYCDFENVNKPITVINLETGLKTKQYILHILQGCKPLEELKISFEEFKKRAKEKYGDRFRYTDYSSYSQQVTILDTESGKSYSQIAYNHLKSLPRTIRYANTSRGEETLMEKLKILYPGVTIKPCYRPKWLNRKELDFYLVELGIAIEFNGTVYHHSSVNCSNNFYNKTRVDCNYHLDKFNTCLENGVKLIHIFDFEDINLEELIEKYLNSDVQADTNEIFCVNPSTLSLDPKGLEVYKPIVKFTRLTA